MRGCNARPVKDALGDPVVACRVALGIFPCRNLRHVYNDAETRPFASVGKVSRCLDESGAHGIAKVGGARTRCSADRIVMVQKIADHDLASPLPKRWGPSSSFSAPRPAT